MKKLAIAGASVVALAGAAMPMVGVFADDDQAATDTITVEVEASCTFSAGGADGEYEASGTNASGAVSPVNTSESAVHNFTVFCNNNSGYTVSASTDALKDASVSGDVFAYSTTNPAGGTVDSSWHAQVATSSQTLQVSQLPAPSQGETTTSGTIASLSGASATGGESFSVTYSAYIGTETPAGTYTADIDYTLAANS